jgi:hypothetical protein
VSAVGNAPARAATIQVASASSLQHRPAGRRLAAGIAAVVAGLVPWTVFLAFTLDSRFQTRHWDVAWVGFDAGLIATLAATAWAAWFRRQILVPTALVAATLLVCDAWFDVATSLGTPDQTVTIATALLGELPLAAFLFWLARRIMLRTLAASRDQLDKPRHVRLHDAPLLLAAPGPRAGRGPDEQRRPTSVLSR